MSKLVRNKEQEIQKTASTFLIFSVFPSEEFLDSLDEFLLQLTNMNTKFGFEPENNPHITLFGTPATVNYSCKLELVSFARKLLPPSETLVDLEIKGLDWFSQDKKTLVIVLESEVLRGINQKLCDFMKERGVELSEWDYTPHITLGRCERNDLVLPAIKDFNIKLKDLKISIRK